MNKSSNEQVEEGIVYKCGRCAISYYDYKVLVAHLFWRHGTESRCCKKCGIKRWEYAVHVCNLLPTDGCIEDTQLNTTYCLCGEEDNVSPMIACDWPECIQEWFHYKCVGIDVAPDGKWICPQCLKLWAAKVNIIFLAL
ncbi:unnamed protein product [Euphydryas editha]|uniref:PHD-type domain-containing protein n=1 Tax=Euphydryas editha TaxID=104508 RepID=A0AAU9V5S3_EUPED|nr:unnamed protein product [Euphydryas editha]